MRATVLSKFADDVSTDDMSSAKYVTSTSPNELARICMRDLDPAFPQKMAMGGFVVAGKNFGCGSSREWGPIGMKAAGTLCVVAEEFARIFYRNAINIGLPVIECYGAEKQIDLNDELEVDVSSGIIINHTKAITLKGIPIPDFLLEQLAMGGLKEKLRKSLHK
ncbi:MAG: 3-isopropylmalate dehydratase small subunit [Clostridiales Family XIII bacterium]|nr:3-isopropylmalate dehydratase small subunit [Clostridiales Family XIII bacterium]